MKSKVKSKIFLILITTGILLVFTPVISKELKFNSGLSENSRKFSDTLNLDKDDMKVSVVLGRIHIDANWTAAKSAGICTGEGTSSNPYVIENLQIDGENSGDCILIENSDVYFIIRNCVLFNSSSNKAGISLDNVENGNIINNEVRDCKAGIWLLNAGTIHNVISGNQLYENGDGIKFEDSANNEIKGNMIKNNNLNGISLLRSGYNEISENTIISNVYGISTFAQTHYYPCRYNTISSNHIINNSDYGILLRLYGDFNTIILNCFITNGINAYDNGSDNQWDNGIKGNYWSNYTGSDSNNDGIGDSPQDINGLAGSQDNFPLMKCPTESSDGIPMEIIILISTISGGAVIAVVALVLIRRKKKRKA